MNSSKHFGSAREISDYINKICRRRLEMTSRCLKCVGLTLITLLGYVDSAITPATPKLRGTPFIFHDNMLHGRRGLDSMCSP